MDWLRSYTLNIAVVLIFTGFLGLVLPGGKYKEYIKLVTGVLVILIIISPVAGLMNSGGYEALFKQAEAELNMNITGKERPYYYDDTMAKTVLEVYAKDIRSQLEEKIAAHGFTVEDASIYIEESNENFGRIIGIDLILEEGAKEEKNNLIKVDKIKIEPISKKGTDNAGEDTQEIKKLKNFISDFYNLSVDNIHIKIR